MITWGGTDFANYPHVVDFKDLLFKLSALPFEFFPTGSRFFGHQHLDSDVDFIVQQGDGLTEALQGLGFVYYEPRSESDLGPQRLGTRSRPGDGWSKACYTLTVGGVDVEIIASQDAAVKVGARDLVKQHFALAHREMQYTARVRFWEALCATVAIARGSEHVRVSTATRELLSTEDLPF